MSHKSERDFLGADVVTEGDRAILSRWNAMVPDPRTPGKLRLVHFVIEMRMQLVEDDVDAQGRAIDHEPIRVATEGKENPGT
jgi:hypothetical protein